MSETIEIDHRFFHRYRYGLVDASQRDELPKTWRPLIVAPTFLGDDTARSPALVDLLAIPDDDRYALLDRLTADDRAGSDSLLSLALESDAAPEQLVTHLRDRLVVRVELDQPPMQFRYYDPGTFIQLPPLLGTKGMRWLFGPIVAVAVPWCREWRRYARPDIDPPAVFVMRPVLPALMRLGAVNRVLTQLPGIRNQQEWCDCATTTSGHLARAETRHGLSTRDDLVAFALHAWTCHPEFDDHPTIRSLLLELAQATPEDELDYQELTARLDDTDWQRIALDMNTRTTVQGRTS